MDRRVTFWALYLPPLLWLGVFFLVPLALMATFSFHADLKGGLLQEWSLKQYDILLDKSDYWWRLGISVLIALTVALSATTLAYPVAYFLAYRAKVRASFYLILLLVPFWTSYLLRVMAWKIMLGSNGVINSLLLSAGLIDRPLAGLVYNFGAVFVTLIYVWIPFAALPILAALQRIDLALFEAAADLGATPAQRFWRIVFPLSLPGVLAAFFMVFIPTVGEYVTPELVGGSGGSMVGNIIRELFDGLNWPLGSALSMIMLALTLALVALAVRLIDVRRLIE